MIKIYPGSSLSEDPLTRCRKCKAVVIDTDAVLDAARIGQEALDKANALQFSGIAHSLPLSSPHRTTQPSLQSSH